jgi:hypothetical protein
MSRIPGRLANLVITLGLMGFVAGCVGSDEPVMPASESIFDSRLVGSWADDDDSERWLISRLDESGNAYLIEHWTRLESTLRLGYLGHLGGQLVLEVSPYLDNKTSHPGRYQLTVLEFGAMSEPDITPDQILVSILDREALTVALESGELRLAHRPIDRYSLVLEGATQELRDRLGEYLERPGVLEYAFEPFHSITDASLAAPRYQVDPPCLEASPWPEADQLFRQDPRWLGADAASSLDLEDGRILWIFDNTRFDAAARGGRWGDGTRIGTTVALQHGADPVAARMTFYWGVTAKGEPSTFVPWRGDELLRFGGGVRLGDRLVLYFMRLRERYFSSDADAEYLGWAVMMVDNPDDEPCDWHVRSLGTPDNPMGLLLGNAGVLRLGGHVYAFGSPRTLKTRPVFAARWPEEKILAGDLGQPEWWAGDERGWVSDASTAARQPLFETGPQDVRIHLDPASGLYLAVQSAGSEPAMTVRAANSLVGPWSDPALIQAPAGYVRAELVIRATRAHPGLAALGRLLTVRANFAYPWEAPQAAHFPRFLRLTRCANETLHTGVNAGLDTPLPSVSARQP